MKLFNDKQLTTKFSVSPSYCLFLSSLSSLLYIDSFYGFSSHFESNEEMTVFCETKVCSFGNVTAELAHRQKAVFAHGRYHYHSQQPLCEYMAEFLDKLRHLPEIALMNHVLENFTILKVITDEHTKETLLCIAFIFEVSEKHGATHNIYKLKGM